MMTQLLQLHDEGLYCPAGDFYIDPWRPRGYAVLTHAHADHCRGGASGYLAAREGEHAFRARLPAEARVQFVRYGETIERKGVTISLHPAGHILGSSQVRIAYRGEVVVISGDYKLLADPTCSPFEPLLCDTFVTESTFALPVFRWPEPSGVIAEINAWWRENAAAGRTSLLLGYALGKAQRLLHEVETSIGPVFVHGSVASLNDVYRASGIALPGTRNVLEAASKDEFRGALVVAPPSVLGSTWIRRLPAFQSAFVSGWMPLRGMRRRRAADRGFVMSDHADWQGTLDAIAATGAGQVLTTHGYSDVLARWLREERRLDARPLRTFWDGPEEG